MLNTKGFTLIELLVVVLIIGILAAVALPQYFKAVERSKAGEALSLIGSIRQAQERYRFGTPNNVYSDDYAVLDITLNNIDGTAASGTSLRTNNFTIVLGEDSVVATRVIGAGESYVLSQDYITGITTCTETGVSICDNLKVSKGGAGGD